MRKTSPHTNNINASSQRLRAHSSLVYRLSIALPVYHASIAFFSLSITHLSDFLQWSKLMHRFVIEYFKNTV